MAQTDNVLKQTKKLQNTDPASPAPKYQHPQIQITQDGTKVSGISQKTSDWMQNERQHKWTLSTIKGKSRSKTTMNNGKPVRKMMGSWPSMTAKLGERRELIGENCWRRKKACRSVWVLKYFYCFSSFLFLYLTDSDAHESLLNRSHQRQRGRIWITGDGMMPYALRQFGNFAQMTKFFCLHYFLFWPSFFYSYFLRF